MVQLIRWLMLFGAWAPVLLVAQAPPPSGVYTCVDAKGRKLTSDRPIAECVDREQRVLNPSGTVQSKIAPEPTQRERAEQEARERKEVEARTLQAEEKRRERALLVRYPSREVHDKERNEAVAQVGVVTQAANRRIDELAQERRNLDVEMEFYKKDPSKAPPPLRRQIDNLMQSVTIQRRFIAEQDTEVRRINARFDEELLRLKVLWSAQAPARSPATAANKTP